MITSNNESPKVELASLISKNLLFRNSADELFKYMNDLNSDGIIVDFNNIESVTRAFSHQYLIYKKKENQKRIIDINLPSSVKKMFKLVEKTSKGILLSHS